MCVAAEAPLIAGYMDRPSTGVRGFIWDANPAAAVQATAPTEMSTGCGEH